MSFDPNPACAPIGASTRRRLNATVADSGVQTAFHTASLRVNFVRSFHGGADAHYFGRPVHLGRSSGVAEAQAVGQDGRVALVARVTAYR